MKITDLDLEEMIVQIAGAVSPFVFGDLGAGTSAKTYTERANLQGEVMGRILAVLMFEEVSGDEIARAITACACSMRKQTLMQMRNLIGPK